MSRTKVFRVKERVILGEKTNSKAIIILLGSKSIRLHVITTRKKLSCPLVLDFGKIQAMIIAIP